MTVQGKRLGLKVRSALFQGVGSNLCLIQGTVLVVSASPSRFHPHPFQNSSTSMLRFPSIWFMFNGSLNLPPKVLIQITSFTKFLHWKKRMDPLYAAWFLWPMFVAVFSFFLGLDSLPLRNGLVVMSWTYVIHSLLIISLIKTCTVLYVDFDCKCITCRITEIADIVHCKLVISETK